VIKLFIFSADTDKPESFDMFNQGQMERRALTVPTRVRESLVEIPFGLFQSNRVLPSRLPMTVNLVHAPDK